MSNYNGAYYVVGGVPFAVLLVGRSAVSSQKARDDTTAFFRPFFPQVPIVLANQLNDGRLQFWGEQPITQYLAKAGQVQWCNWSFK